MTRTDDRLRAALADRAAQAAASPDALLAIRERIRRRRLLTRLRWGSGLVATAAAIAVAVVYADPAGRSVPAPLASAGQSGSPAPSESAPAAESAPLPPDQAVAFLADGRLVAVSTADASVVRTLHAFPAGRLPRGAPAISPDRRHVVVAISDGDAALPCKGQRLHRVDVGTGASVDLGPGWQPAYSPDGRRLASVGSATQCNTDAPLVIRDLADGTSTVVPVDGPSPDPEAGPAYLADVVWHPDGSRLYVVEDWEDSPVLLLVDPSRHRWVRAGERVGTEKSADSPALRGDDLVYLHSCCYPEADQPQSLRIFGAGRDDELISAPARSLGPFAVGPDGDLLYLQSGTLYRLDVETGFNAALGALRQLRALAW